MQAPLQQIPGIPAAVHRTPSVCEAQLASMHTGCCNCSMQIVPAAHGCAGHRRLHVKVALSHVEPGGQA
jgi:hypothetical protein